MKQTAPLTSKNLNEDVRHGVCAVISEINVDTDAIFPKQYLTTIRRTGLEDALFADWRFNQDGSPNKEFILNQPGFEKTRILIGGDNFGCGSSREHAVWALRDFGIDVIISTGFGSIFRSNCIKNGIWPLEVTQDDLVFLMKHGNTNRPNRLTLRLSELRIYPHDGNAIHASLPRSDQLQLQSGLDEVGITLSKAQHILEFEKSHHSRFPWLI